MSLGFSTLQAKGVKLCLMDKPAVEMGPLGEPILIRFDGLDADDHVIELSVLAKSLTGLSKIISASAHFSLTQEITLRKDRQDVRVVIQPPSEGCFTIHAIVQYAHQHPLFASYTVQTVATLSATVIAYVFGRFSGSRSEEMKHLSAALEKAITELGARDGTTVSRLLETVDKLAVALTPATREAVAPVGVSARTLKVGIASVPDAQATVDEAVKAAIMSKASISVDQERSYDVLISELDMDTGSCHVHIAGEPENKRHLAKVTDPAVTLPNNP